MSDPSEPIAEEMMGRPKPVKRADKLADYRHRQLKDEDEEGNKNQWCPEPPTY
jgi:hypothetical protein